jgi:protease-4
MPDESESRQATRTRREERGTSGPALSRRLCGFALLLAELVACDGRPRTTATGGAPATEEPRVGPAIVVLDLSSGLPEQSPTGPLGLPTHKTTYDGFAREVERLSREKELRGVLVKLGTAAFGLARATEVGDRLAALGARAPVWCHADGWGNATLYAAARGCKRIWVSPATSVDAVGIAGQMLYFRKLLADEIGLSIDFLQVGKYKGAEEPFTRDGPSPEARESLESTLADLRGVWIDGLRAGRPGVAESTPEDGPYSPARARELGLVDDVGYFDEARDALEKQASAVRADVRLAGGSDASEGGDLGDVLRAIAGESLGTAPIALVRATGEITLEGGGLLGSGAGIVERRLGRTLMRLEHDDDVKAVVLRIDSPGGSALASDLLWHELMKIRAEKPLVVSIGGMAASGGYYLASTGSVVFADAASIVGSIGVVGGKIGADRALEKIGVHAETFASKPGDAQAAARALYGSLLVPWDDATRARLLETMTSIYELFLARVAEGRKIPREQVAASAEGRIFSGRVGKARGLVDELGGLQEAIERARSLAGLPADARVAVAGEPSGLLEALGDDDASGRSPGGGVARAAVIGEALGALSPELRGFVASLAPLAEGEHAACALPFALDVH